MHGTVFQHGPPVIVGVAVTAEMPAGMVGADIAPEKAPAAAPGRRRAGRNDKFLAQRFLQDFLVIGILPFHEAPDDAEKAADHYITSGEWSEI